MKDENLYNLLRNGRMDFGHTAYSLSYDLFPEYLFDNLHPDILQRIQSLFDNDLIEEKVVDLAANDG